MSNSGVKKQLVDSPQQLAARVRLSCLEMTSKGGSSHIGACLSVADILAVLYFRHLASQRTRKDPSSKHKFILSKGHAGAALYATLAHSGYFSIDELDKHYSNGSVFSGHVSHKGVPGVDISTGSLGHGLSIGCGFAYVQEKSLSDSRTFVVLSDGECDEGSTWEAVLFAAHHRLSSLIAIVDYNKIQSLGDVAEVMALEPFRAKWESFGWQVAEVDGHNCTELDSAISSALATARKPTCIIAHTIKGKGVSFMENKLLWHYRTAREAEYDAAREELLTTLQGLENA